MELEQVKHQLAALKQANADLEARLAQLERVEQTLNAVLEGTAAKTGDDFFISLVRHMAAALDAKYALVGELTGTNRDKVRTIAFWQGDRPEENFTYDLAGSPCATVITDGLQYYAANVQKLFPEDQALSEKQIECYIGVPVQDAAGNTLGILVVMHDEPMKTAVDSVPIINLFAARAGAELERKHSEETLRTQRELAEALQEIGLALSASLDVEGVLDLLLDQLGRVVPYDTATVIEVQQGQTRIVRARGYETFNIPLNAAEQPFALSIEEALTWQWMVETKRPLIIPDINESALWQHSDFNPHTRSWASAPVLISGEVVAFLSTNKREPFFYTEEHGQRLAAFAAQAAVALQNARLFAEANARAQELNLLNKVISAAASGRGEEEIKALFCQEIGEYLAVDHVTLMEVDESLQAGWVTAQYLPESSLSLIDHAFTWEEESGVLTAVTQSQTPLSIPNLAGFPLTREITRLVSRYGLVSALLAPIPLRGNLIGIMGIASTKPRIFNAEEIRLTKTVCEELGRILETARLYDQLRMHAAELEERVLDRTSELAAANEQLKELDTLKSQFVSDVSHELRTPVTNLKLYLDLLEHKGPGLLPKYLPILQKQADRLSQLIQDILDLSRLDMRQNAQPGFELVDLNSITQEVILAHQPRAEVAGLHLAFSPYPDLPPVAGERNQLAQVVTNLLVNAINYTEAGVITVQFTLSSGAKQVCLTVKDTGIGIAEDDVGYLFDRFYRGQKARQSNIPGTGLGLAIAQEIVRIHGGHIEVSSEVGQGSTFRVYLPVAPQGA